MRLYAQLIFAFFVLHARAASIKKIVPDIEKKISEAVKEVLEKNAEETQNAFSEPELIEQTNAVKDFENNLRNHVKKIDDIPVRVIIEEVQPSLKNSNDKNVALNEVIADSEDSSDIKRVEIDLKNPGPPQRQEHETQNPEHYEEEHTVTTIRQTIKDTQDIFNQGLQGITQGIQNWFTNNEQIATIQENIQNLQDSFTGQISKLNETIQSIWKPGGSSPIPAGESDTKVTIENVESGLKVLENNFEHGVKSLATGVETLAILKQDNGSTSNTGSTTPSNPSGPFGGGFFAQYLQSFQHTIVEGFNNVTHAIQNYVNQNQQANLNSTSGNPTGFFQGIGQGLQNIIGQPLNNGQSQQNKPPAGAQSDTASASTSRPTIWSGIQSSIQNIPNGPIGQAIQNNPLVQGVVNLIQPKPPASNQPEQKPSEKPSETPATNDQPGNNAVPASNDNPVVDSKPPTDLEQQNKQPEVQNNPVPPPSGPIQQIIQRNPIVQGIAGAVQRIQHNINNPEKPRDAIKENEEKVFFFDKFHYGHHGGHHGSNTAGEHNNHIGGVVGKSEPASETKEEPTPEQPLKEKETAFEQPLKEKEPTLEQPLKEKEPAREQALKEREPALEQSLKKDEPAPKQPLKQNEPAQLTNEKESKDKLEEIENVACEQD